MENALTRARRLQSWPKSLTLFAIATVGEFLALSGWYYFHNTLVVAALAILWAGFIVERAMVVLWLGLPKRVFTPGGNLHKRWVVIGGVTLAEIIVWVVWIGLAENGEPGFAAATLVAGIHIVHAYEVAVLKQRPLKKELMDKGVILITILESVGGVLALWLVMQSSPWPKLALGVLFGALLIEHILQVIGLKTGAEAV
jgi:hypothetical protein